MLTTLISATDLAERLGHPDLLIVDCRHELSNTEAGPLAYAAGHLPTARFIHLDRQLSGAKYSALGEFLGRHPLPLRTDILENCRQLGINQRSQVIAYDAHGGMFAARLWWLLRWLGHEAVAVLDGGLPMWQQLGYPLDTQLAHPMYGDLADQPSLVTQVNVDEVLLNISSKLHSLVDARSPDRYRGENETLDPVGGHIPGAKNRFFKDNLQADGCFTSAQQLRDDWLPIVTNPEQAIMQCGSGVTACHNLLALEIAGLHGAALYAGSWSEWCANPARPIAIGS